MYENELTYLTKKLNNCNSKLIIYGFNDLGSYIYQTFKNRVIDSDKRFKYIEEKNDEIINEIDDNLISNFKMPLSKSLFVYFRYYMFYLFKLNFSSKPFKIAYNKFKQKYYYCELSYTNSLKYLIK